jgi:hypothetical protein
MKSPYFKVKAWLTDTTYKLFVFVGEQTGAVQKILTKLEQQKSATTPLLTENEKATVIQAFGLKYEDVLGVKYFSNPNATVIYVSAMIYPDDNISWLKRKLFATLQKDLQVDSHDDFYVWLNKKVPLTHAIVQTFLTNAFQTDKRISYDQYETKVHNFFSVNVPKREVQFIDKQQALSFITDDIPKTFINIEPMFFKYANDVYFEYLNYDPLKEANYHTKQPSQTVDTLNIISHDAYLVESLGLDQSTDDVLHLMTNNNFQRLTDTFNLSKSQVSKLLTKYFPYATESKSQDYKSNTIKFFNVINDAETKVHTHKVTEGHTVGSFVNFLHLRVNELNFNKRMDLERLFETLVTSKDIPFIKFKSLNNIYYKVHKETVVPLKPMLLGKWTENKINQFGKTYDTSYILLKVQYSKDVYCSLLIFDNLCYDIKFSFGSMMRETIKDINKFLYKIDNIIAQVQSVYEHADIPPSDKGFATSVANDSNTKVLRWLMTNNIKSDKLNMNYQNFSKIIQNRLFSFFNVIRNPNKNIMHLQYKKVDNYLKYENIQVFITNNFVKDKEETLKRIVNEFVISREDAEKEYDRWFAQNELEVMKVGDRTFIKPKNDNFVNIKVRLTSSVDMNFNIEGAKNNNIQERIIHLLVILMEISNQKNVIDDKGAIKGDSLSAKVDNFLYGNSTSSKSPSRSSSYKDTQIFTKRSFKDSGSEFDDDFNDFEALEEFGTYDDLGDMYEDDDDLRALEQEFLKETNAVAALNPVQNVKVNKATSAKLFDDDDNANTGDEDSVMKSYFMNMLKSADRDLIDYKVPKGDKSQKSYSRVCQWNGKRQPVVVNTDELAKIQQYNKNIKYIKTGSTPELQEKNFYLCPQVWCPKSKIALTYNDYKNKYNESCPFPDIEEKPILLVQNYWGKGEEGLTREHFPGFLDAFTHPKKFCLPCCFKKEAKEGSKNKQKENTCKNQWNNEAQNEEEPEIVGNEKYIKAEFVVPLEVSRYGLLPKEFSDLVGNTVCGNGTDGKGLMNDKTNCLLRKGVSQKTQSFLHALLFLLDNPKITTVSSFLKHFNQHVSVERFVALENGKVMKLFIKREFDIFDPHNFQSFIAWFLDVKQQSYIKLYKLQEIANTLSGLATKKQYFTTDEQQLPTNKHIIREFLIYNAYIHFIKYVNDMSIEKNFNLLIDYVQTESKWLNIKNYNIVVIEHEPAEGKTHMICPFNRNAKMLFDLTDPFVFIFKQNNYYEPLAHVKVTHGDLMVRTNFLLKTSPEPIKKLVQFYMQNCTTDNSMSFAQDIELYVRSLGLRTKRFVIDYSFRVCGFLTKKANLFIPLKTKVDVYDLYNSQFVYYDEIPNYKCRLGGDEIEHIFKKLYKYTTDDFYKLNTIVMAKDGKRVVGVLLNKDHFVPINYVEEEDSKYINEVIEDDLNIFIGNEKMDIRKARIQRDQEKKTMYKKFAEEIVEVINKSKTANKEYQFLSDPTNPFPVPFKHQKLLNLMESVIDNSKLFKDMSKTQDIMRFANQYIEELLIATNGNSQSIILKQLFGLKKKFKKQPHELIFDQKDVIDGKLNEKIKFIQNPYASLMARLDDHMKDYVLDLEEHNDFDNFKRYINPNTTYEDVPYKFRKILPDYLLVNYDNYTINTLYDLFLRIAKTRGVVNIIDMSVLKNVVLKQVGIAYKHNDLELFFENASYQYNEKVMKLKKSTMENILTIIESMNYYPSFFELMVLSEIAKVNVIIIGRKRKNNEEGIDVYHNNSSHFLVVEHSYDRFNYRDIFKIVIKGAKTATPKILFRKHELSKPLVVLVEKAKGKL